MTLLVWSDQLRVGVDIIDQQHRELVRLANELAEAMKTGQVREVLERQFAGLTAYTIAHFATEDRLMRESGYAGADAHRREHKLLRNDISELMLKSQGGKLSFTPETLVFLREWLIKHILHSDRDLAQHLTTKAGKPAGVIA